VCARAQNDQAPASRVRRPGKRTGSTETVRRTVADGARKPRTSSHADVLYRVDGTHMALFTSDLMLARFQRLRRGVTLDLMLTR
jgi:hypothetical protein